MQAHVDQKEILRPFVHSALTSIVPPTMNRIGLSTCAQIARLVDPPNEPSGVYFYVASVIDQLRNKDTFAKTKNTAKQHPHICESAMGSGRCAATCKSSSGRE
jgi:hypothetical protein